MHPFFFMLTRPNCLTVIITGLLFVNLLNGCNINSQEESDPQEFPLTHEDVNTPLGDKDENTPPIVNINSDNVAVVGLEKSIIANVIDMDNDVLDFSWQLISTPIGSNSSLTSNGLATTSIIPDIPGKYLLELSVTDGNTMVTQRLELTAQIGNVAPVAVISSEVEVVSINTEVRLSGARSYDENSDLLNYNWALTSKPEGSSAFLNNRYTENTSFTADLGGEYIVSLTTSDGEFESSATKSIYASAHSFEISWPPNTDSPSGYTVFVGPTENTTDTILKILVSGDPLWNPSAPKAVLSGDIVIAALPKNSSQACFAVRAYNSWGYSELSSASCILLP